MDSPSYLKSVGLGVLGTMTTVSSALLVLFILLTTVTALAAALLSPVPSLRGGPAKAVVSQ